MNDNNPWPRIGEAAASRVAQILAQHACWNLAEVSAHLGMPLAGFLENRSTALLVAVTSENLPLAAAQMEPALIEARADGLIIADERDPWFPPTLAIGHWASGKVSWHLPLLPYLDDSNTLWLVPRDAIVLNAGASAFRLIARYLKPEPLPWGDEAEHLNGLERAGALLRRGLA